MTSGRCDTFDYYRELVGAVKALRNCGDMAGKALADMAKDDD